MSQMLKEKYVYVVKDKDLSSDVPMRQAQRQVRLLEICQRDHERRASESEEQRSHRNERLREYCGQILTNEPHPAPTPESVRQQELSRRDLEKFQKEIQLSPTSICCTCERLCYPKGVSLVDVHDVLQQHYHASINDTQLSALLPNEEVDGSVYVCSRCMAFIIEGRIPPFATINNMHVDKIPHELSRLNTMEQRLISGVQAFMKLIVLPLGQRALAGKTIIFLLMCLKYTILCLGHLIAMELY